jgi:hypothetical protein
MYVAEDVFMRHLPKVAALHRDGYARLLVSRAPSGAAYVQLELVDGRPDFDERLSQEGLSTSDLESVGSDYAAVLTYLVNEYSLESFVRVRTDDARGGEAEPANVAERKYRALGETFDLVPLRRRAWLKRIAKSDVPVSLGWHVGTVRFDDDAGPPPDGPVPFGEIKLVSEPAEMSTWGPPERNVTALTVDAEDVDFLIDGLERLRDALRQDDPK